MSVRVKGSVSGIHGLDGAELRQLRALRRDNPHAAYVFMSERKAPMSTDGAQKLNKRLGETAGLPFPIHAHMLRHSAGYALAGRGVDTTHTGSSSFTLVPAIPECVRALSFPKRSSIRQLPHWFAH
jgi:integrase